MKKLFVNKTTYNKDTYMEFLRFHAKTFNFHYITYTIFWVALFALCIYLSFSSNNRVQGMTITFILIGFLAYRIYHPKSVVDKELKSDKIADNNTNTFTFFDNYFEVSNKNGTFNYRYFMLHRIYETKSYFYLYVTRENAFILSKKTFSLGKSEEFSQFLKKKFVFKYRHKNY